MAKHPDDGLTGDMISAHPAYLRVSTDDQDVDNQRHGILEYANSRGFANLQFTEDSVTGKTSWRERKLGELIESLSPGDVLIFAEISRIARSTLQVLEVLEHCVERNIAVHIAKQKMVLGVSMQSLITATVLTLQEYYGGRDFFDRHLRPWLTDLEKNGLGEWVKMRKYGDLYSYGWWSFSRVFGSKYHVAPPTVSTDNRIFRQLNATTSHRSYPNCRFPRWLNKKWHNLKQSKLFTVDYRLQSLFVTDEKNAIVINKYTCAQMRSKTRHYMQAVVKSLNGCSSGYQCLTVSAKSDFVLEIKFGKISYDSSAAIDCNDEHISQEFVYGE